LLKELPDAADTGPRTRRRILEETLSPSLSVVSLARQHGLNANQVFYWRKLYRVGQLDGDDRMEKPRGLKLLLVSEESGGPSEAEAEQILPCLRA